MVNSSYFKSVIVEGANKEEALAKSGFATDRLYDVTQKYNNFVAKNGTPSPEGMREWEIDTVNERVKGAPGVGFYVTLQKAVENKKESPWARQNVKREGVSKNVSAFDLYAGDRYIGRVWPDANKHSVVDADGNTVERTSYNLTKKKGMVEGTALANKLGLTEDITAHYIKADMNGNDVAFVLKYTPSKNTQDGKYIVFGMAD